MFTLTYPAKFSFQRNTFFVAQSINEMSSLEYMCVPTCIVGKKLCFEKSDNHFDDFNYSFFKVHFSMNN